MLFNAALFSGLLLSPVVLALPFELGTRIARRGMSSQGNNRLEIATSVGSNTAYTDYWAGAWLFDVNEGTFSGIAGTFIVPTVSGEDGAALVFWLALDGSCSNGTLGAGVSAVVGDQGVSYSVWYNWLPDAHFQSFSDPIQISTGDTISITVNAWTPIFGTVTIENHTNGQSASQTLNSSIPLCEQEVEWIVVENGPVDTQPPLADFGTLTYTNAYATKKNSWYSPLGANTVDIKQNGTILTSVTTDETSVTIQYI